MCLPLRQPQAVRPLSSPAHRQADGQAEPKYGEKGDEGRTTAVAIVQPPAMRGTMTTCSASGSK
jgi:hypothetical protein